TLTGLPPGDYDLKAYEAGSYTPTAPDSIEIQDLSQGEVRGGFEFGFDLADEPEFAIIYGFKFVDENANGVWENDERGMGRVEIEACWEEEFSDCDYYITNSDGSYTLTVPTNTAITLSEESDGTFEPTTPPGGLVEYESVSGSEPLMVIFGNAPVDAYGTVFGTKFFDENGNGVKDPDEDGMPGVTIRVTADAYTYFTDSTEEGGPEFEFEDISETGTEILSNIDDATEEIPIGFEFNFYGKSYESAVVDTNGKLFFEGAVSAYSNEPLDETNLVRFVAPFWDDLVTHTDESDAIYYQTVGSAPNRMLIVQWNVYHIASSKSPISFQVVLFEGTNEILFN